MPDELKETDELATTILRRLDAGEITSHVVPAVRHLAELQNDRVSATWLELEDVGLRGAEKRKRQKEEIAGAHKFIRLHGTEDLDQVAADLDAVLDKPMTRDELPERNKIMYQSVAELEGTDRPAEPTGELRYDERFANAYARGVLFYQEAQRVLRLIRSELYAYASKVQREVRGLRVLLDLFGTDAFTVFSTGGPLLDELRNAANSLQRAGMSATAAQQARTAMLTLGRELYGGPAGPHTSPIDERVTQLKPGGEGEINKLHAYIDDLWAKAPQDRKELLRAAQGDLALAYELGSKAKNPFALTGEEARTAVLCAYRVAHAICFAGGFPPPNLH